MCCFELYDSSLFTSDHRCSHTYTPPEDREEITKICRENVCRCTQGKMFATPQWWMCVCVFTRVSFSVCFLLFLHLQATAASPNLTAKISPAKTERHLPARAYTTVRCPRSTLTCMHAHTNTSESPTWSLHD